MSNELQKITNPTRGGKRIIAQTLLPGAGLLVDRHEKKKEAEATAARDAAAAAAAPDQPMNTDMPEPDSEAVNAARRRRLAAMQNRGGRQSTILSEPLGGV